MKMSGKIAEFSLKFLCVNPIFPDLRIFFIPKKDGFKMNQSLDKIMQIPEPTGIQKARREKTTA